ncbi:DUF4136 domain-containing protein [Thalassotalea litorea]|uniref:DUF4136 domain-containing protein n=1 Tax=Thalassotalea litorea TaxID=2020715 RepID=A0A5R9ISR7_9GAMM|nr:DUF4136 domain-containing protein [Thalassotalea litorea]TLU66226.1 DUF4136 domain-containing protein [Thalassotalea litorea]
MKRLLVVSLVVLLSACASSYKPEIDYNPEYNFSQIKSFTVLDAMQATKEDNQAFNMHLSDLDNDRIIRAININLENKGLAAQSTEQADIQVRYQVVTKDKTRIRSYNTSFYSCWSCGPYYGGYNYGAPVNQVDVQDYVEGTLIIDMIDPKLKKSIWRSQVSEAVKDNIPVEEKQARIQELVDAMLASFQSPSVN